MFVRKRAIIRGKGLGVKFSIFFEIYVSELANFRLMLLIKVLLIENRVCLIWF